MSESLPRQARRTRPRSAPAFSLLELVTVVVIIGILAAMAAPRLQRFTGSARSAAFARTLNTFINAVEMHHALTGEWITDAPSGKPPAALANDLDTRAWQRTTPAGGRWDIDNEHGGILGIGVHGFDDLETLIETDHAIDDGNPDTGNFRRVTPDRYYWVITAN